MMDRDILAHKCWDDLGTHEAASDEQIALDYFCHGWDACESARVAELEAEVNRLSSLLKKIKTMGQEAYTMDSTAHSFTLGGILGMLLKQEDLPMTTNEKSGTPVLCVGGVADGQIVELVEIRQFFFPTRTKADRDGESFVYTSYIPRKLATERFDRGRKIEWIATPVDYGEKQSER